MQQGKKIISLVIPFFNEGDAVRLLRAQLDATLAALSRFDFELILINDGSSDNTLAELNSWANQDQRVIVLDLSRNFGQQAGFIAGLKESQGEAVITMDSDLQDPPSVIADLLISYEQGFDVVHTRRLKRQGDGLFKVVSSWLFYRLINFLSDVKLIADSGDFRLFSRRSVNAIIELGDVHLFMRGLSVWIGFKQKIIDYSRAPRSIGETKFSLTKMVAMGLDAVTSFSTTPLKVIFVVGLLISGFGAGYGVYSIVRYLAGATVPGWTGLVVFLSLIGGSILIAQSIVGLYIGKIFEQSKNRPRYLVASRFSKRL